MFTRPHHSPHNQLPIIDQNTLYDTFKDLGVQLDPDNVINSAADYAMTNWLPEVNAVDPALATANYKDAPSVNTFSSVGMIDEIAPRVANYTHALVDGGVKKVYDYRLAYLDKIVADGVSIDEIIIFGGQRFRKPLDDATGRLEEIALTILPRLNSWGRGWVGAELSKENPTTPFTGSFATEHHVGILALLDKYGKDLEYCGAQYRLEPINLHPDLPSVNTHFELFTAKGLCFKVLNSPAIIRSYLDVELPLENARPTGSSCFNDWETQLPHDSNARALLVTSNPHVYRSWHDILLGWNQNPSRQVSLDAAGAKVEKDLSQMDMLWEFGRLIVSLKRASDRHLNQD